MPHEATTSCPTYLPVVCARDKQWLLDAPWGRSKWCYGWCGRCNRQLPLLLPLLLRLFTLFTLDSLHIGSVLPGPPPSSTFHFILQRQVDQHSILEATLAQSLAFVFEWLLIQEQTLSIRWRSVAVFVQRRLEVSDGALAADTDEVLCPK